MLNFKIDEVTVILRGKSPLLVFLPYNMNTCTFTFKTSIYHLSDLWQAPIAYKYSCAWQAPMYTMYTHPTIRRENRGGNQEKSPPAAALDFPYCLRRLKNFSAREPYVT